VIVHPPLAMGREAVPLSVIDAAHPAPETLQAAVAPNAFRREPGDYYPGIRAAAPPNYTAWLAQVAGACFTHRTLTVLQSSFAIAIDEPAMLAPIQRIPHFDTTDPTTFAAVHYLCAPPHRGTRFYRHCRTGYERIDASRAAAWRQALTRDRMQFGMPGPHYPDDRTLGFDCIGEADLRFNRLILYPANCLHAGDLSAGHSPQVGQGRLTITSLLQMGDVTPGG